MQEKKSVLSARLRLSDLQNRDGRERTRVLDLVSLVVQSGTQPPTELLHCAARKYVGLFRVFCISFWNGLGTRSKRRISSNGG